MLRDVGLDTTGWSKETLVENCEIYKDLIILPKATCTDPVPSTSKSTPQRVRFNFESNFEFRATPSGKSNPSGLPCTPRKDSSTSALPSLQPGALRYPRPPPTVLDDSPTNSKQNKGQARAHSESDNDYNPDMEEDEDQEMKSNPSGPPCTPRTASRTSVLPSLQHGTLRYPRPPPTVLDNSPTNSKQNKGKARAHSESDDDYNPELEEDDNEEMGSTENHEDGFHRSKARGFHGQTGKKAVQLQHMLIRRIPSFETDVDNNEPENRCAHKRPQDLKSSCKDAGR
ncbi:uncharacterized protein MELLADRAFT_84490 [Melampsora larici-populina 98AG31]|uniref:Uncharacterized protein n=1 Tax=Melampsora larici-populina (strain 98AG31 / pathotype 3-4-7) TaxID=747676 RepID=F4SC71_MELLP|nr:uncharacterized protein MELLADRAFT_84490 [Melampsora larici-populina 98AG31]EGF97755.1 hypothetical protein MELLADRAFT_84490 [Melampsora larici-populina 98AG31]